MSMPTPDSTVTTASLARLQRRVRRTETALVATLLIAGGAVAMGIGRPQDAVSDEIRTRRLVVVDEAGTRRVVIEEEPADADRRARAAGIVLFDRHGNERGGIVTFDDDTAVIALDAPAGVGAPMRDRLALRVNTDGTASLMLLDNRTAVPVRLVTDADGGGGLEFLRYDLEKRTATVRRLDGAGETSREISLGGG
jgi:hypothetical protein